MRFSDYDSHTNGDLLTVVQSAPMGSQQLPGQMSDLSMWASNGYGRPPPPDMQYGMQNFGQPNMNYAQPAYGYATSNMALQQFVPGFQQPVQGNFVYPPSFTGLYPSTAGPALELPASLSQRDFGRFSLSMPGSGNGTPQPNGQ